MRWILLPLLLAAVTTAEEGGVIVLDNQQTLRGTVTDDPLSPDHVLIRDESGTLRLRRSRIKSIEPSLTERVAAVPAEDTDRLIALGRELRARGRNAEALEALQRAMERIRANPGALRDLGAVALYLRLVDEIRGPESALPLYRWYRTLGGTDPATIARLQALEAVAGTAPGDTGLPPLPAPGTADPAARGGLLTQGLELRGWVAESPQWSNEIQAVVTDLTGKDALKGVARALQVTIHAPKAEDERRGKAVIRKPVNIACVDEHVLSVRIKNTGEAPLTVALAVKTGDWVFYESKPQAVKQGEGWKELRFDLTDKSFKTKATNWSHATAVEHLDEVRELQVMFYTRDQEGSALLSAMRFLGEGEL